MGCATGGMWVRSPLAASVIMLVMLLFGRGACLRNLRCFRTAGGADALPESDVPGLADACCGGPPIGGGPEVNCCDGVGNGGALVC